MRIGSVIGLLGLCLCCGCKEEVDSIDTYRMDWIKVVSDGVFTLLNRQETRLYDTGTTAIKSLKTGERAIINYAFTDGQSSGFERNIKINSVYPVICGDLKILTAQEVDKLENDPIVFESVWMGRNYLNISFYIDVRDRQHAIGLVKSPSPYPGDINALYLLFRHGRNGDRPGSRKKVYASFDLGNLMDDTDKRIIININPSNDRNQDIEVFQ
jgi:hypothetical protein